MEEEEEEEEDDGCGPYGRSGELVASFSFRPECFLSDSVLISDLKPHCLPDCRPNG